MVVVEGREEVDRLASQFGVDCFDLGDGRAGGDGESGA